MPALAALIEGYHRFRGGTYKHQKARFDSLASEGQAPRVMVIACSDSRVDPATIFDADPGVMFVVRNVANLVPPFETGGGRHGVSAALEYAVTQLEVEKIIVLGHGKCGGVAAALSKHFEGAGHGEGHFIAHWIDLLDDCRDKVLAEHGPHATDVLEREGIKASLANLLTFPWVKDRVEAGSLALHGALFDIEDGVLHVLDETSGEFAPA